MNWDEDKPPVLAVFCLTVGVIFDSLGELSNSGRR